MSRFRTLVATVVTSLVALSGLVTPAVAQDQIVSTFDGAYAAEDKLAGYTTSASVLPGEVLKLRVRSAGTWSVMVIRIGSHAGGDGRVIDSLTNQPASSQPDCTMTADTLMVSCPWNDTLSFATGSWPTGLYVARLDSSDGFAVAPFVVRSSNNAGKTVVNFGLFTLAAYNKFGGTSAYRGIDNTAVGKAKVVSLDRPIDSAWALPHFIRHEASVAIAADRNLTDATWTTGVDMHNGATSLSGVTSIITSGHDEYWTVAQRKALDKALSKGTNLFITGGNTLYWRVRLQASSVGANRQMAIYKEKSADPVKNSAQTTVRWRHSPKGNPESKISGTVYNNWHDVCNEEPNDWIVTDPTWWGYNNTGVTAGTRIPGLVGREVDQLMTKFPIPKNTRIVAHGSYICGLTGMPVTKLHDATFITLKSGASVFATGSQMWPCAMNGNCVGQGTTDLTNRFTRAVTDNVIQVFDAGKVKKSWRAKNNVKTVYGKTKFKYIK